MLVTRRSPLSGIVNTREVAATPAQFDLYIGGGAAVQDAFPHLTADDREFIKTGITPEEWASLFDAPGEEACEFDNACN